MRNSNHSFANRRYIHWILSIVGSSLLRVDCVAQAVKCDERLVTESADPWRYRERGSRCEGTFLAPMNGATLVLVGIQKQGGRAFDFSERTIKLTVPSTGRNVMIRAISLRWRTFYRMDTSLRPGQVEFVWPTEVLRALKLQDREVGVFGLVEAPRISGYSHFYLPVSVMPRTNTGGDSIRVTFIANIDLQTVDVQIRPHGSTGSTKRLPSLTGVLVARRPFKIDLPTLPPGVYSVLVTAKGDSEVAISEFAIQFH